MSRNVRRKKHKIIKTFGILVAFVLVIGTTVAITLALLNKQTDTTINTFTGNKQLDLDVREPDWDGKGGNSYTSGDPRKNGSGAF